MATFFLFGHYTADALEGISAKRTGEAAEIVRGNGGELKDAYALLGEHDLALIVELPDVETAMKVSVALNRLTGIAFRTAPAIAVESFDTLIAKP